MSRSLPQDWLAAIRHRDSGTPAGLGVFVQPNHLVTCSHVVAAALGLPEEHPTSPDAAISIQAISSKKVGTAKVAVWHPVDRRFTARWQGMCLLEVEMDGAGQAWASWDQLTAQEPRRTNMVKVFGYPFGAGPGKVSFGYTLTDVVDAGWWQLDPPPRRHVPLDRGFNGSLVWDTQEDKPVGLLVARYGDQVYLIPTGILRESLAPASISSPLSEPPPTNEQPSPLLGLLPYDVFLCHSSQDKPQVRELARILRRRHRKVFLDEEDLVPGRPWMEALETAIQGSRAAAILYGPAGIGPWALREMRAFLEEFIRRDAAIIPVLLPGSATAPELPVFLRQFQWVDLRGGFTAKGIGQLLRGIPQDPVMAAGFGPGAGRSGIQTKAPASILSGTVKPEGRGLEPSKAGSLMLATSRRSTFLAPPGPPLFRLWNVPPLPDPYQPRGELEPLRDALTGLPERVLALEGTGGAGKTVLAAALARDPDVRRAFPDGIYWVTLGQPPEPIPVLQGQLASAITGRPMTVATSAEGEEILRKELKDRTCLLVLDDACEAGQVAPFDVTGALGKLLVTTREREVAPRLNVRSVPVDGLPATAAAALLAGAAVRPTGMLPPEAPDIVRECGELPLALGVIGSMLRDQPAEQWRFALAELRRHGPAGAMSALQVSIDSLPDEMRSRYRELAVFPKDTPIPETTLCTFWAPAGLDERAVADLIDTLVGRSLLRRDPSGGVVVHDIQHRYFQALTGDLGPLHRRLVEAYRAGALERALHAVDPDGYFFEHIAGHLVAAEGETSLRSLLFDVRYLQHKIEHTSLTALLADFDLLRLEDDLPARLLREALGRFRATLSQHHEHVQRLWKTLGCPGSPPALDGPGFKRHMVEQLAGCDDQDLSRLVEQARATAPPTTLFARWRGPSLPKSIHHASDEGHTPSHVTAVAVMADGVVSASNDATLKVWDVNTGELRRTLKGHTAWVQAVALTPEGLAVSASHDWTLKVWDVRTGALRHTLQGHTSRVNSVAVTADDLAVSASFDETLKVWDLETGQLLRTLEGHRGPVTAVAATADGLAVSASRDGTLKTWEVRTGKLLTTLEGHTNWVEAVGVTAGGLAISTSLDGTLKVWDVKAERLLHTRAGGGLARIAVTADGLAICGLDQVLRVWQIDGGRFIGDLGSQHPIRAVAMAPDDSFLVIGDATGRVHAFDRPALLTCPPER